jgi:hypothetical protein
MLSESFDIVSYAEQIPIDYISESCKIKLSENIKKKFSVDEQKLFITNFIMYLNYDEEKDFVINFDDVWKWVGFTRKDNAKTLLQKHFKIDIDYNIKTIPAIAGIGGKPREIIMLTINTFKKFCLSAGTKKASEIHDYYIKLENI